MFCVAVEKALCERDNLPIRALLQGANSESTVSPAPAWDRIVHRLLKAVNDAPPCGSSARKAGFSGSGPVE